MALIRQAFCEGNIQRFHLYLQIEKHQRNRLLSTVPEELLQQADIRSYTTLLRTTSQQEVNESLRTLGHKILKLTDSKFFYYPDRILSDGKLEEFILGIIFKAIYKGIPLTESMYSPYDKGLFFFAMQIKYMRQFLFYPADYYKAWTKSSLNAFEFLLDTYHKKEYYTRVYSKYNKAVIIDDNGTLVNALISKSGVPLMFLVR